MRLKNILLIPLALLTLSSFSFGTIYENGENSTTSNWRVYDNTPTGATISNVTDSTTQSKVIEFKGERTHNSYLIGARSGKKSWKNSTESKLKWDMNFKERYRVSVYLETRKGKRTFYYDYSDKDKGLFAKRYIRFGLGKSSQNGKWTTIKRDLVADLKKFDPNNKLLKVHGIRIQGSGKIDNIELYSTNEGNKTTPKPIAIPLPINPPKILIPLNPSSYFNGEDGSTQPWFISKKYKKNATATIIYDNNKKSNVIKFNIGGYRLGAQRGLYRWKNKLHTIQWAMNTTQKFRILIYTETEKGIRIFHLTHLKNSLGLHHKKYIRLGLGEKSKNGHWHLYKLNLKKELEQYEPDNKLLFINGFKVYGSGLFDDIKIK